MMQMRRELYRANQVSQKDMIENLTVMLGDEYQTMAAVEFPCEEEIMEKLSEAISNVQARSREYPPRGICIQA